LRPQSRLTRLMRRPMFAIVTDFVPRGTVVGFSDR
jgi:hypothetical protein